MYAIRKSHYKIILYIEICYLQIFINYHRSVNCNTVLHNSITHAICYTRPHLILEIEVLSLVHYRAHFVIICRFILEFRVKNQLL